MERKTALNLKDHEVAVKSEGSTICEEYFALPEKKRISKYKVVVVSSQAKLIFVNFIRLRNTLYPYPDFMDKFLGIARVTGNYERHYKKMKMFKVHNQGNDEKFEILKKNKEKSKKELKRKRSSREFFSDKKDIALTANRFLVRKKKSKKRKVMANGGYNTLLKGKGLKMQNNFNIEDRIEKSGAFKEFINSKKKVASSFNLKNYLKSLKVDDMTIGSSFCKSFVVPPSNLSSVEKLEMISKSKRAQKRFVNSTRRSNSLSRLGMHFNGGKTLSNLEEKKPRIISKFKPKIRDFCRTSKSKSIIQTPIAKGKRRYYKSVIDGKEKDLSLNMTKRKTHNTIHSKRRVSGLKRRSVGSTYYLSDYRYKKSRGMSLEIEGRKMNRLNNTGVRGVMGKHNDRDTFLSII